MHNCLYLEPKLAQKSFLIVESYFNEFPSVLYKKDVESVSIPKESSLS